MEKIAKFIVLNRKVLIIIYAVLVILSIFGSIATKSNYDIISYMPESLNSIKGDLLIREHFGLTNDGILVIDNYDIAIVSSIKKQIENINGVKNVLWVDDIADITVPVNFLPDELQKQFFSKNATLLTVEFNSDLEIEEKTRSIEEIKKIAGKDALFGGEPVILSELQQKTKKETLVYTIIAIIISYIVLSYMLKSFLTPLILLIATGSAIILNMGTNVFKDSISFLTLSVAPIMQLAISADYAIFLLDRYEEEKNEKISIYRSMTSALVKSTMPILSSALTTIAGFISLMFMRNGIGVDLGFVLCKGIIFSLITNFTLLPCLIILFNTLIENHKMNFGSLSFVGFSNWILRWKWLILAVILIVSVPAFIAQKNISYYLSYEKQLNPESLSIRDTQRIKTYFNVKEPIYVITKDEGNLKEKQFIEKLNTSQYIESVNCFTNSIDNIIPETFIPDSIKKLYINNGYRYVMIKLTSIEESEVAFKIVTQIRDTAKQFYNEYYVTGSVAQDMDILDLLEEDSRKVSVISISLILLIIAISFKSFSLPFILVLTIQLSIWINLGISYFQNNALFALTPVFIGAIQLGATIDYAILFTSRYIENLTYNKNKYDALRLTIVNTLPPILTSALAMLSATIGISFISSIESAKEITLIIGRGAIISMLVVLLVLPALLLLFDKIIKKTTINVRGDKNRE